MAERAYAKDYPDDAELAKLVEAFEAGNYRAVRAGASLLAKRDDASDAVKSAARDLRARTEPSRAQLALLLLTALLVIAVSGYEIATHGRDAPRAPQTAPTTTIERIH